MSEQLPSRRNADLSVISLRLFTYGVRQLHDANWTGCELYDYVKQCVRGRVEPKSLLRRPLEHGLAFSIGGWVFDEYFNPEWGYFGTLGSEYQQWYLEDLLALVEHHAIAYRRDAHFDAIARFLNRADQCFEEDKTAYYKYLDRASKKIMPRLLEKCWVAWGERILDLKTIYASSFGDRVLHDRQLCEYIANLLLVIGFDGALDNGGGPRQWIERVPWPEQIKTVVRARDRGRCAICGAGLVLELETEAHIDHIVPLSRGGCNDIVNLQLLCGACNVAKGALPRPTHSSVPSYMRRRSR